MKDRVVCQGIEYEQCKEISVIALDEHLDEMQVLSLVEETRGLYLLNQPISLSFTINNTHIPIEVLLDNGFIKKVERKKYKIGVSEGVLGEDDIRIFLTDEKKDKVYDGNLLTIYTKGTIEKRACINKEVATLIGIKLDGNGKIIIEED